MLLDRDKGYPLFPGPPPRELFTTLLLSHHRLPYLVYRLCARCALFALSLSNCFVSFFFLSFPSLYSIYFLQPRTLHSAFTLLAPGTCIGLTRFRFGILPLRLLCPYPFTRQQRIFSLHISASSVHTSGSCCVRIPLPDDNSIYLSLSAFSVITLAGVASVYLYRTTTILSSLV